jgi:hypothetical protein
VVVVTFMLVSHVRKINALLPQMQRFLKSERYGFVVVGLSCRAVTPAN